MSPPEAPALAFDDLNARLQAGGMSVDAAEFHGLLCGVVCACPEDALPQCLARLGDRLGAGGADRNLATELMAALAGDIRSRLHDTGFEFELILPDDEEPLQARVEALALWCAGFLEGMTHGGVPDATRLPGDAGEAVADMVAISAAQPDPDAPDEEQEAALAEIREYVRVGVQLIYEELHAGSPAPSLH